MKKSVSIWVILLVAMFASSWVLSCRDDVEVPFPPSIVGNYTGIYQFIEIHGGVDTVVDTTQLIEFQFRQNEYIMDMDGTIPESTRVFCDVMGEYTLGNGVEMSITDSNYTRRVCTGYWSPGGYFSLNLTSDTVRLFSDFTDTAGVQMIRSLRLVNVD